MAYTPPSGNLVDLNFNGEYFPSTGEDVQVAFGNVLDNWIRVDDLVLEAVVTTTEVTEANLMFPENLVLELSTVDLLLYPLVHLNAQTLTLECICSKQLLQILPDIVNESVILNDYIAAMDLGGGTETDLPTYLNPGFSVCYGGNEKIDVFFDVPWGCSIHIDKFVGNYFIGFYKIDCFISFAWKSFYSSDNFVVVDSSGATDHIDDSLRSSWGVFFITDRTVDFEYGRMSKLDKKIEFDYNEAFAKDRFVDMSWDESSELNKHIKLGWSGIGIRDIDYSVNYGPRALYKFCFEIYQPPPSHIGPNFVFPPRNAVFDGVGEAVGFIMDSYSSDPRCETIHMYTGIRDINIDPGVVVPPNLIFRVKKVYYMLNSVLVKEVPTNSPIETKGLTITIDRDSWLWQLSMVVGSKEYLDLIKPIGGSGIAGLKKVEVNINGWKWIFTIEGWQRNASFAKESWTVTGRSPSLIMGDPICSQKSYIHDEIATGSSIIDSIITAGGYSYEVSYAAYDDAQTGFDPVSDNWNITANAFSYANQTDIQAIQSLVESIGGYIQTEANFTTGSQRLNVLPKYPWQPWHWNSDPVDISYRQLDQSLIAEVGSSYRKNPDYMGVYIIGGSEKSGNLDGTGIFCNVFREGAGSAGLHAPILTSPLYTTDFVAQEKGRSVLGDSGMWMDHTVRVFSLFPEGTLPGLFKVGDMIRVTEGASIKYRGIVTSVSIAASLVNGSAFNVAQTLGVSEYMGDWVTI